MSRRPVEAHVQGRRPRAGRCFACVTHLPSELPTVGGSILIVQMRKLELSSLSKITQEVTPELRVGSVPTLHPQSPSWPPPAFYSVSKNTGLWFWKFRLCPFNSQITSWHLGKPLDMASSYLKWGTWPRSHFRSHWTHWREHVLITWMPQSNNPFL